MRAYLILFSIFFIACTPQQRISRILRNHPDLMRHDTVTINDTVVTKGFQVDSAFKFFDGDTVTVTKENVRVKLIYIHDTLKTSITQKSDTIIVEKRVPVNRVIEVITPWYKDKVNICLSIAAILLMLIIIWLLKKH